MHPVITLGGAGFRTWLVLVTLAVGLCWALLVPRAARSGYAPGRVLAWVVTAYPIGILCSRLLALLVGKLFGDPTWSEGMTMTGAALGSIAYSWLFLGVAFKAPRGPLFDAVAFTIPLSIGLGRLGCLLEGCCFGQPASHAVPSFLTVAASSYASATAAGQFAQTLRPGALVWNFPLLISAGMIPVLVASEWIYRRRSAWRLRPGTTFLATLFLEESVRFLVEFVREEARVPGLPVNPWQGVTLLIAVGAGLALAGRIWRRRDAGMAGSA